MTQKSGIFKGNFKAAIRPQDDMYRHVNGGWLDASEIPSDRQPMVLSISFAMNPRRTSEVSLKHLLNKVALQEVTPKRLAISTPTLWTKSRLKS